MEQVNVDDTNGQICHRFLVYNIMICLKIVKKSKFFVKSKEFQLAIF